MTKPTITELTNQLTETQDKWKRALADYQNLEKRIATEKSRFIKLANATLITKLLIFLDNLERALAHHQDQGIKLIIDQLKSILAEEGVKEITVSQGVQFDPQTMECVEQVAGPEGKVTKVSQSGYWLGDIVIRPACVEVGNGEAKVTEPTKENKQQKIKES